MKSVSRKHLISGWIAGIYLFVAISGAFSQDESKEQLVSAIRDFYQMLPLSQSATPDEDRDARTRDVLAKIAAHMGIKLELLTKTIKQHSEKLLANKSTGKLDAAHALFVSQKFAKAEEQALDAFKESVKDGQNEAAVISMELAAKAALEQAKPEHAIQHYEEALGIIDKENSPKAWSRVSHRQAYALAFTGDFEAAARLLHEVALYRESKSFAEIEEIMATHADRAEMLRMVGKTNDVVSEIERVVELAKKHHGVDSEQSFTPRKSLVVALTEAGRYEQALAESESLLASQTRILGASHLETLDVRGLRAMELALLGRHAEAASEHRAVYLELKRLLGVDHPETLISQNDMAVALNDSGKHKEAEQELNIVIEVKKRVFGPEHLDTIMSLNNLGNAIANQDRFAESLEIHRKVHSVRERELGVDHLKTLEARLNLAIDLNGCAQPAEAESLSRGVLEAREKLFGPEDAQTLMARSVLANALCLGGKEEEGLAEYRALLDIAKRLYGDEDSRCHKAKCELAWALFSARRYDDARPVFEENILWKNDKLGSEHPETLRCRLYYCVLLANSGDNKNAQAGYRDLLTVQMRVHGHDHSDTLLVVSNVASLNLADGLFEQAEQELRQVLAKADPSMTQNRYTIVFSQWVLAQALAMQFKFREAVEAVRASLKMMDDADRATDQEYLLKRLLLGRWLSIQGETEAAESELTSLAKEAGKYSDNPLYVQMARHFTAMHFFRIGKHNQARSIVSDLEAEGFAVMTQEQQAAAIEKRKNIEGLVIKGNYDLAEQELRRLIKSEWLGFDADDPWVSHNTQILATICALQERHMEAIKWYRFLAGLKHGKETRSFADRVGIFKGLIKGLLEVGRINEAIKIADEAIRECKSEEGVEPVQFLSLAALKGAGLGALGQHAEALELLGQERVRLEGIASPRPADLSFLHHHLAISLSGSGEHAQAEALVRGLKSDMNSDWEIPPHATLGTRLLLCRVLLAAHKVEEAEVEARAMLGDMELHLKSASPTFLEARAVFAQILMARGLHTEALSHAEQALQGLKGAWDHESPRNKELQKLVRDLKKFSQARN